MPAPLRPIALRYRRLVFDMLFACAADTLLTLGRDPDRLGAQLAVTVGISNARIRAVICDGVRFGTKAGREVTLAPEEFLRRLLLHVLPRGRKGEASGDLRSAGVEVERGPAAGFDDPETIPNS